MRDKNFIDNLNWEDKAKKNPLFAIMSDSVFENKTGKQFTEEDLKIFYKKGEYLWDKWISSTYARLKREKSDDITVAEYGCGMGRLLYQADKRVSKSIGVDISDTQIELAKEFMPEQKNVSFVKVVPGEPINIDNQVVDLFYSFAVLQHIKSRKNLFFALDEMVRTLRPGGYLCLQTRFLNYQGSNGKFIPVVDKLGEKSSLALVLRRIYGLFYLPQIKHNKHTHWGGAGCYLSPRRLNKYLKKKHGITPVEIRYEVGSDIILSAFKLPT